MSTGSPIELDDLSRKRRPINTGGNDNVSSRQNIVEETPDTAILYWSYTCSAILMTSALCLSLTPRIMLFLSETTERRAALTPLESFLATHFGIWLAAISIAILLNTPSSTAPISSRNSNQKTQPLLGSLTFASSMSAMVAYHGVQVGALSTVVLLGSGALALWGIWAILFEGERSISKTTGADKHTSSFIFGNKSAASKQKQEWKKQGAI